MSSHNTNEGKTKSSNLTPKQKLACFIGLGVIIFLVALNAVSWAGLLRWPGAEAFAANAMDSRSINEFHSEVEKAKNLPDYDQAASRYQDAKVVLAHKKELIHNYHQNCPDSFHPSNNGDRYTMVLSNCKNDTDIQLRLKNALRPTTWKVQLYYFGKGEPKTNLEKEAGHQLNDVPTDPVIKVLNEAEDDGSRIKKIAPHVFEWTGFTKLVYQGNADFVEITRQ